MTLRAIFEEDYTCEYARFLYATITDVYPRGYNESSTVDHVSPAPFNQKVLDISSCALSVEHYFGITLASMPTLKPLFTRILDITVPSQGSSNRSFQKIRPPNAIHATALSHPESGRSSIHGNNIRKTTEFRVSSQLELEIDRDYELSESGTVPEFLRQSNNSNSWAHGPGVEMGHDSAMRTGGYRHIDDAPDSPSFPRSGLGVRP